MRKSVPDQPSPPVDWLVSNTPVDYEAAVSFMEARVGAIHAGIQPELIWLLEHPPLYTAGTSARPQDLLTPDRFPVYATGRGGQYTYHGPGQRIIYVMLDVSRRGRDVRAFVTQLENWLIHVLAGFHVRGVTRSDRVGIWVPRAAPAALTAPRVEDKIAAIGIRLRKWISYHGMSLNVDPDLTHFEGIVPCGITGHGVTSLAALGHQLSMSEVDAALRTEFEQCFQCETRLIFSTEQTASRKATSKPAL